MEQTTYPHLNTDSKLSQSSEAERAVILGIAFLLIILGHYTLRPVVEGMLVKQFGAGYVPLAALVRDIFALPVTLLVVSSHRRSFRLSRTIGTIAALCCVTLVIVPSLVNPMARNPVAFLLYLVSGVLSNTGLYCTWMLFTSTVVTKNCLYFTLYGCGAQVGVILSSTLAKFVLGNWGTNELLWLACSIYVIAYSIIVYAITRFACFGGIPSKVAPFGSGAGKEDVSVHGIIRLLSVPYTRSLCFAILLQVIIGEAIRWKIFVQADKTTSLIGAAEMLSGFFQQAGLISLAMQLIVVPVAFLLTVRRGLMIQPILAILVVLLFTEHAGATLVFLTVAIYISCEYTLNNCMREVLYIPLPLSLKVRLKSALSILVPNVGHLVGSGIVFSLTMLSPALWQMAVLAIVLLWLWCAWHVSQLHSQIANTECTESVSAADEV